MNAIAPQQWTRMVSWGMANGSIGIGAAPSQYGSAIDDEIASANEPSTQG